MKIDHMKCSVCGTQYAPDEVVYTCPKDGGNLDLIPDYAELSDLIRPHDIFESGESSLWRYLPLLPVADPGGQHTPIHRAGWTPVYQPLALAKDLNLEKLWIKDESPNPSASFKDRASAIVMARAKEIKADVVVAASTGNAGAANACMAAALGMNAVIFAPKTAPQAKIAQLLVFGAKVLLVDGNYDQAFDLSIEASHEFGWYNRNTGFNPYTAEGKKTAAYEIWEQVLVNQSDDAKNLNVFIPVGDGNIISGIYKGFKDLLELGWIKRLPRLIGVQAEGSAAIANAFNQGVNTITPVQANTIADSISVDLPRDGYRALRAVRESNGTYVTVTDQAILNAIPELGKVGIFAEPAGATAYAGLVAALENNTIQKSDPILVLNTGSGLKDVKACMQAVQNAQIIEPTLDAVKKVMF